MIELKTTFSVKLGVSDGYTLKEAEVSVAKDVIISALIETFHLTEEEVDLINIEVIEVDK